MKSKGAFTLIELLVVLALITILGALGYAGVMAARNKADSLHCVSNLRQWGIALNLYMTDHDGELPRRGQGVQPLVRLEREEDWFNALPPYLGLPPFSELAAQDKDPKPGDNSLYTCPCAEHTNEHPYYLTYGMNMYLSRWDQPVPSRLTRLPDPKNLAFMADSPGGYASTVPSSSQYSVQARHNGKANVVFVDGHVESFSGEYLGCGSKDKTQPDVRWKTLVAGDVWTPNL